MINRIKGLGGNPVYRRDLARWSKLLVWRRLGPMLGLVTFGGAALCLGLPAGLFPPIYLLPHHSWSSAAMAALVVLLAGSEALRLLTCLAAAALSGLALNRVEDQPIDLLRLVPMPGQQVALARLGAALRPLRLPLLLTIAARVVLAVAFTQQWSDLLFTPTAPFNPSLLTGMTGTAGPVFDALRGLSAAAFDWWEIGAGAFDGVRPLGIWPLWLAYYLLQPALDVTLFAAVGALASLQPRAQANRLAAALGAGVAVWVAGYLAERVAALMAMAGWSDLISGAFDVVGWLPGVPAMGRGYIAYESPFEVTLLIIVGVKCGLLWALARLTARRLAAADEP